MIADRAGNPALCLKIMDTRFKGNWATLLLPIREDDSIDFDLLKDEIKHLISCDVNGIYSNGTAGEFFSQSEAEFHEISTLLATLCKEAGMPFQIGCSHMDPSLSLNRIRFARNLHPDAIQVILPDWFPANDNAAIRFLKYAAEQAEGIPLVLYNPPHAKRRLSPAEFLRIAEAVPEIRSIKTADGDDAWYEAMKPVMEKVSVFIPGHHLATGVSKGAAGAYSNVACLSPSKAQKWYNLMLSNMDEALDLEKSLRLYFTAYIDPLIISEGYPNFAIDKFMAAIGGYVAGMTSRVRFPYDSVDNERVGDFRKALKETAPFFAEESIS